MKTLDVGCGKSKYPGAIGLDINPKTNADVIHDLGISPYPFDDDEFDRVICSHVVEHVPDIVLLVSELHRITKKGGRIDILVPHYTNGDWSSDPTHRNHISSFTFNAFNPETRLFDYYSNAELKPVKTYVSLANLWRILGVEFLVNLDQKHRGFRFTRKVWEHYLSYMFRGKELKFEFEVLK